MKFLITVTLFVTSISPARAHAQISDDAWSIPQNLSHSGVASNPSIVLDSAGIGHALWQDDLDNFVYARLDGDNWSAPVTTDLNLVFRLTRPDPRDNRVQAANYDGPNPVLIPGADQFIFAFWITQQGRIFTSSVHTDNFNRSNGWDSGQLITQGAVSFAATIDSDGGWHLTFLRTDDAPATPPGIYYTRSKNRGQNWTNPVLLYESPYYRTLEEGQAHLSIATGKSEDAIPVYVAWDNRPRKQVFMAQSMDGGETWNQTTLVAGPMQSSGLVGPFNIHVGAIQRRVVLVWENGTPGGTCSQIYQSSSDAGTTWNDPQPVIEDLLGCAQSNEFVTGVANDAEDPLYFLTETHSQVFLSAWNGLQWSEPQAQATLAGFEEPEIYTNVVFGCRRASRSGERLYVIGCDESGGGDVWVTSRDLGSNVALFASPTWSQPSPLTRQNLDLESVGLTVTGDGLIHAILSQQRGPTFYYTTWDGTSWSRMTPVLELPDGEAGQSTIAAGPGNELYLFAPNNRGSFYFSRVTSGDAGTRSRWSTPTQLELGRAGGIGAVDVAVDAAGTIYVAYSVPANDERGIYLVLSSDRGTTWSQPLQVFDGAAAGFELVGAPTLQISDTDVLHLIWKEQTIQGDGVLQPLSLYYIRSEDGGRTFGNAELIVEEAVDWRELVTDGQGDLHLLWQPQGERTTVWDQVSFDGGRSWEFPQGLHGTGITFAITVDVLGRLHLIDAGSGNLGHWTWSGNWQQETSLPLEVTVESLVAAINTQGNVVVAMTSLEGPADTSERIPLYSSRTLELPTGPAVNPGGPAQTLVPPTVTVATSTPQVSSTLVGTDDSGTANSTGQTELSNTNGRFSPLILALIPVALLLFIALGIVIRRAAKAKDR